MFLLFLFIDVVCVGVVVPVRSRSNPISSVTTVREGVSQQSVTSVIECSLVNT